MSRRGGAPWWAGVGVLLGVPALIVPALPPSFLAAWTLYPAEGLIQSPLRWWTCAWLHINELHLLANVAALAVIVLMGWLTSASRRAALAWFAAWPLTHLALMLDPRLSSYVGLSGVLHAGVAVIGVQLARSPRRADNSSLAHRRIGWALLTGLVLKTVTENPHLQPLVHRPDLAMDVAPISHLAGTLVGAGLALALLARDRYAQSPP